MASTQLEIITALTRKILAIIAGVICLFILVAIIINVGNAIKEAISPTPPPPPTVSFGKLPPIPFPPSGTIPTISYNIDTLTGSLPVLPTQLSIYKFNEPQPDLLALDKTKQMLDGSGMGFTTNPIALSDTDYIWINTDPLPKKLQMNILSKDFTLNSDYINNQAVLYAVNLIDPPTAVQRATQFMQNLEGAFPTDIDTSKTKTSLYSINSGIVLPATSLSTAQIIRVDFFQKDVDKLPILYSTPFQSLINVQLASAPNNDSQVIQAQMIHKTIGNDKATYPIKTAQQALNDLKKGNAYIASISTGATTINIQNISLAYYISDLPQTYLIPIIVFQGDNNFTAYVTAVTDEWVSK